MGRQIGFLPTKALQVARGVGEHHPVVAQLYGVGHGARRGLPDLIAVELVPGLGAVVLDAEQQVALGVDGGYLAPGVLHPDGPHLVARLGDCDIHHERARSGVEDGEAIARRADFVGVAVAGEVPAGQQALQDRLLHVVELIHHHRRCCSCIRPQVNEQHRVAGQHEQPVSSPVHVLLQGPLANAVGR